MFELIKNTIEMRCKQRLLQKLEERSRTPETQVNKIKRLEDEIAKAMKANQAKEANRRLNQQTNTISIHNALIQALNQQTPATTTGEDKTAYIPKRRRRDKVQKTRRR